jgi:hypothetical protein
VVLGEMGEADWRVGSDLRARTMSRTSLSMSSLSSFPRLPLPFPSVLWPRRLEEG